MKSLITILLLLLAVAPLHAGWFFKDPPPPPPDLGPEYRAKINLSDGSKPEPSESIMRAHLDSA